MQSSSIRNLTLSALFLALGLALPQAFHLLGTGGGTAMLPMHIPVLLCGFVCGWRYGAAVGALVPLLSSAVTGMPPFFPIALAMALELAAYGALTGLLHRKTNVYAALLGAMLGGRLVSGVANAVLLGIAGKPYGLGVFVTSSFVTALPGIVLQIVAVPLIVLALERVGFLKKPQRV